MGKVIAIDGPAGSGKGTIAAAVAKACNLVNIDTGATYRSLALAALRNNFKLDDTKEIINLAEKISIELTVDSRVLLDGEDVTDLIRSKEVTNIVSQISSIPEVREIMVNIQRKMAEKNDAILEGRDITTVVFPNADYKFYLDASLEERVERRFKQNEAKGIDMTYDEIRENIKIRDHNDMNKPVGALKRTNEQIYIDTTNMSIDDVISKILSIVRNEK